MVSLPNVRLTDIAEAVAEHQLPPLDRSVVAASLTPDQAAWRRDGVLTLEGFLPNELVRAYLAARSAVDPRDWWANGRASLSLPEARDLALYPPLVQKLRELIGTEMGLHAAEASLEATPTEWHQDDYLNMPAINGWSVAVWMALEDVDPRSGPFEFIRGSHTWPLARLDRLLNCLTPEELDDVAWPAFTQEWLSRAIASEIEERGLHVERFLAKRGDVLIWHARLAHRTGTPQAAGVPRRSFVAHYSALSHRRDLPVRAQHRGGGWYFVLT